MSPKDIHTMSINQRLYLMEQLWDSFQYNDTHLASPQWHKALLEQRKKQYDNGELKLLTFDELKIAFKR
ncbi:MAG: addiction module protein [Campylobacterales bacterium]|nr:addiction module protein [Campylobacterales bacterium]